MNKLAFIYPGQGSQKCGMGKDFYEKSSIAQKVYDDADAVLDDIDIKSLCFEENNRLHETEYTQAALVTTCLAITADLLEKGLRPDVTAGLSLGEYAAIAAAGGISYQEAVSLVRQRGIFMQEAAAQNAGAMGAVLGMKDEEIEAVIQDIEGVSIANYNCPGQTVITGSLAAVEAASKKLTEAGARKVVPLNVSGAFHSPYLKEAGEKLGRVLKDSGFRELKIPYVTNVTAEYVNHIEAAPALLEQQVSASVRWNQSVENMIQMGVDTFVEIGPGKTLAGFIRKIDKSVQVYNVETPEDAQKVIKELIG